jgi:hypothetical protein
VAIGETFRSLLLLKLSSLKSILSLLIGVITTVCESSLFFKKLIMQFLILIIIYYNYRIVTNLDIFGDDTTDTGEAGRSDKSNSS